MKSSASEPGLRQSSDKQQLVNIPYRSLLICVPTRKNFGYISSTRLSCTGLCGTISPKGSLVRTVVRTLVANAL